MFTYASNKLLMGVVIMVALFVLGVNTYNEIVTNTVIDANKVIMESARTLLTVGVALYSLVVHKRGPDGKFLDEVKLKSDENIEKELD